jgi:hypothetical protein
MLKGVVGLVAGIAATTAAVHFHSQPKNAKKLTFYDSKEDVHTVRLKRGLFQDCVKVIKNKRTDQFMYNYSITLPNGHLDMGYVVEEFCSFRPIDVKVIPYKKDQELNDKLKAARVECQGDREECKLTENLTLLEIIREFQP